MSYPENDDQFNDGLIEAVTTFPDGWRIRVGGWSFYVPLESPIEPKVGMTARFYGRGIGYTVRGLFLDEVSVFYRTVAGEREHHEIETYGRDAEDWLARWDAGKSVWTIAMGGLGPGYEQAIQIIVAEALRIMLAEGGMPEDIVELRLHEMLSLNPIVEIINPTGAQCSAAIQLAWRLFTLGPRAVMKDESTKDRQILVSKKFPSLREAELEAERDQALEQVEAAVADYNRVVQQRDELRNVLWWIMTKIRAEDGSQDPMAPFAYDSEWESIAIRADAAIQNAVTS